MAGIKSLAEGILVKVLSDENYLLHTVTILLVPIALKCDIHFKLSAQFVLGHCREPLSDILQGKLTSSLFEQITDIRLILKPAHAFGTNNLRRPTLINKEIKFVDIKGRTAIINPSGNAVFLRLAFIIVVMMVVMMMFLLMMMIFIFVMMLVFVMMMFILVVVMFVLIVILIGCRSTLLYFLYPSGRGRYILIIKRTSVNNLVQIHISIVTSDYFRFRL